MSIKAIVYTCANCGTEFRTDGPKDKIRNLALVDTTAADPVNRLCALFVQWPPAMVDRFVAGAESGDDFTLAALCPGCAEAVYRALSGKRNRMLNGDAEPARPMDLAYPGTARPLAAEWTAAEVADYEAFRADRMDQVQVCTCSADFNRHTKDCAYRISVDRIDAAWQAQRKGVPHDLIIARRKSRDFNPSE
jgi:hypothetical protein